ncbi:F-box protein At2g02240-like [Syzygium oleosum]|uniref:F-box protein At2g02240-like n=1 Tax=Syzygium oleosum TaxID=219896 RepID=UPI0024BA66A4|nr:F-box protein At2g02240-like [Syzygium oleosum]
MAVAEAAVVGIGNLGLGIPSSESETRTSDRGGSNAMDHPKEVVEMDGLPEGCVAHIISLTTPRDAARCSAVSRAFHSASDSDAVWRKFLPPDLDLIVSTSPPPSPPPPLGPPLTRKKDVFLRLCGPPLLIDSGRKSFALEKWSGKKCYMIGSRDLSIVWGDTPRFWRWSSLHVSRFPEVAELLRVCWLEVHWRRDFCLLTHIVQLTLSSSLCMRTMALRIKQWKCPSFLVPRVSEALFIWILTGG